MRISDWSSDVCSSDLGDITIFEGVEIVRSIGTAPLTFQLDATRAIFGEDFSIDGGTGPLNVLLNANANNTADPTGEDAGIVLHFATLNHRGGHFWLYGQGVTRNGVAGGGEGDGRSKVGNVVP